LLAQAAAQGCELAVLPEYFCLLGRADTDKLAVREAFGAGPVQDFLAAAAREHGLWLVGGTLPLAAADDAHVRNTCIAWSPQGEPVARYDKIHLFRFDNGRDRFDEARTIEPGSEPVAFDLVARDGQRWRVGLSVCYDLRFPELYRRLGADLLLVPSAFTHVTGQAHWERCCAPARSRTWPMSPRPRRAACTRTAAAPGATAWWSIPWGTVLAQREADGEGVVVATLDAERLAQVRGQLPALEHRVL
jgi:predicted amidohydrolase